MGNDVGGAAAIIGIGQTEFSKAAGRSETQLASEAILAALADAGLTTADVNGLVSYTIDPVEETELVRTLGIPEISFVVQGKNDIFDPRSGASGYSNNAALVIADYLNQPTWGFNAGYGTQTSFDLMRVLPLPLSAIHSVTSRNGSTGEKASD